MGNTTKSVNFQTCICGKVCKGRAALLNHGKKCHTERIRSAAFLWACDNGLRPMSDAALMRNLVAVAEALAERGVIATDIAEGLNA